MKKRLILLVTVVSIMILVTSCYSANSAVSEGSQLSTNEAESNNNMSSGSGNKRKNNQSADSEIDFEPAGDFSVVLVGTGSPNPAQDRASASTLIQYKGNYFLVDMGKGAMDRLEEAGIGFESIETLMFTHHHRDHDAEYFDIAMQGWLKGRDHLNLIGTPGTKEMHEYFTSFYKEDLEYRASKKRNWSWDGMITNVDLKELEGDNSFKLSGVEITTTEVPHSIYTLAYRFDIEGKSIVISGDLTYSENLIELAKDADVLVMDSGVVIKKTPFSSGENKAQNGKRRKKDQNDEDKGHASLEEVATMAEKAGVKKLVLTHIGGNIDEEAEIEAIKEIYTEGEVIIGYDLLQITP